MKWGNMKLEFTVGTSVTLISTSAFPSHLKVNSLQYAIILKVFSCFYCQHNVSRPILFKQILYFLPCIGSIVCHVIQGKAAI